jgi:hypothetical protein
VDAGRAYRGEELPQVQVQDHAAADVRGHVGQDGPAAAEAVGGGVRGDAVEQLVKQPALDGLEAALGDFEQPHLAPARGQPVVGVMV